MSKYVIIGGGVAGLSAANYLADMGQETILIEADKFGRNKVCGEFFSPESVNILSNWDVPLVQLNSANFYVNSKKWDRVGQGAPPFKLNFSKPAGSISRALCEEKLARRAIQKGIQILTQTKVKDLVIPKKSGENYQIILATGQTIVTDTLIVAAGRFVNDILNLELPNKIKYVGIKAHFKDLPVGDQVHMYVSSGAYLGVSSVENNITNIACITRPELLEKRGGSDMFIQHFLENAPDLKEKIKSARCLYDNWLVTPIYNFGPKYIPKWPNVYFIGDAAASVQPVSGNGLAMAVTSGIMAAQHAINKTHTKFNIEWQKRYLPRLRWSKLLHEIFMRPSLAHPAFSLVKVFPTVADIFYRNTRD